MAFDANFIRKQRLALSRQLQDLCVDVALLSQTHLKPHERVFFYNYSVYWTDRFPNLKEGTAIVVRHGNPHAHVDLSPLQSMEITGITVPIGSSEVLQLFTNVRVDPAVMKTPFI
jgi:hypothetical protein